MQGVLTDMLIVVFIHCNSSQIQRLFQELHFLWNGGHFTCEFEISGGKDKLDACLKKILISKSNFKYFEELILNFKDFQGLDKEHMNPVVIWIHLRLRHLGSQSVWKKQLYHQLVRHTSIVFIIIILSHFFYSNLQGNPPVRYLDQVCRDLYVSHG